MINIAVCEDESLDMKALEYFIPKAAKKLNLECCTAYFSSGTDLIEAVEAGDRFDFLILDIFMKNMDGIKAAKEVLKKLPDVLIGFLTGSTEYALDAFELGAVHYIVKPVSEDGVFKLLRRYMERSELLEPVLEFETLRGNVVFPSKSVLKIESYKKGVAVYIRGEDDMRFVRSSFASAEKKLDRHIFLRIARGLAVNMDYIDHISQGICYFLDGTSALISRRDRSSVKSAYNDYLFRKMRDFREGNK